ncbi:MAG TPA: DNA mismatch repair endonuclease MutL [Lachnospiraceae bacterium]|nr:DNA mismatch repair endonuclease MutL [Lachnospiraceae bacterium]
MVIELLDKTTIDKIAAGEVVERPASVVKELTENAIDASSTAITIEIKDGGNSFIRITDNGGGIPADQVRKAFMRHATSKIRTVDDLVQIATLGFRGEALSSISAVARVECITKTPEALTGVRYRVEGGKEIEFEEIGSPSGTTMIVRNLFFNTPARAKFLKSGMTEGNHVAHVVEELALSHPEISFKFLSNGQSRLYTSGNGNLKEIVYQIFGRDLTRELIPVDQTTELMSIHGFIGNPGVARANRNFENYFVNGRFVKDRILGKAIEDAYHGFLMQHRFPFTLLYIRIDGTKVDVNVHPSKMEVRFSSQEEIYHTLCLALQNALMQRERIPQVPLKEEKRTAEKAPDSEKKKIPEPEPFEQVRRRHLAAAAVKDERKNYQGNPEAAKLPEAEGETDSFGGYPPGHLSIVSQNPLNPQKQTERNPGDSDLCAQAERKPGESVEAGSQSGKSALTGKLTPEEILRYGRRNPAGYQKGGFSSVSSGTAPYRTAADTATPRTVPGTVGKQLSLFQEDKVLSEQSRKMYRLIGQVFDTYWLFEYKDALYIMDQHAAHEKVMYERMMKNFREKKIQSQMLFPAIVLDLSAAEADLLRNHLDAFAELGFEAEPFGGNTFKISAVPANLYSVASVDLFTEILGQLGEVGDISSSLIPERLASMSCKAAVKGDHRLSVQEADALLDELLTLENPYNCPHGRPTIISISRYEMDKKFKRIV